MPLLFATACVPRAPTPAVIARATQTQRGPALTACTVSFGWDWDELVANCGKPDLVLAWASESPDGRCAIYRTTARAFATGMGANAVGICLRHPPFSPSQPVRVAEAYGLTDDILPKP